MSIDTHKRPTETNDRLEAFMGGERMNKVTRKNTALQIVELAILEEVAARPGVDQAYPRGMKNYNAYIRPVCALAGTEGIQAMREHIAANWEAFTRNPLDEPMYNKGAVAALKAASDERESYERAFFVHDSELETSSAVAIWLLYAADAATATTFCQKQGLLPYLADAPQLVRFFAQNRVLGAVANGDDILKSLHSAHEEINGCIDDFYAERMARTPRKRLLVTD